MSNWPQELPNKLIIGNPQSNIGIATLWSTKEVVAECLDSSTYCVIANFYDKYNAIEPMIRNCLANPNIQYIIVFGNDLSGSLIVLKNFFKFGIKDHIIINTDVKISKEIPIENIEILRKNIKLIDLSKEITNTNNFKEKAYILINEINKCEKKLPYDEIRIFKKEKISTNIYPSENVGYLIRGDTISNTWINILFEILTYGNISKMSNKDTNFIKECVNLIAIIENEDFNNLNIPSFLKYSKEDIKEYFKGFCYENLLTDNSYTYGNRLRLPIDQIKDIITLLKRDKLSKKGYASTWINGDMFSKTPPCFISLQVLIQNDKLLITGYLRSNDMFRAWPLNAFGLQEIQRIISKELKIKPGPITIISQSAQIYSDNLLEAKEIVNNNLKKYNKFIDPRGYYIINLEKNMICVKHFDNCGKLLREFTGKTEREITDYLHLSNGPIDTFHISYLTRELFKAEICLKFGKEFIQDTELNLLNI